MQGERPVDRSHRPPAPGTRRDDVRAEAVERLRRWKRGTAAAAVMVFGAFLGLIGAAGARGAPGNGSGPPPVVAPGQGPGGQQRPGTGDPDRGVAPDDGFFGGQDGGYGFRDQGSPSPPFGQSGAS